MKNNKLVVWYSRGGNIKKMGPFKTQIEAYQSVITTEGYPVEDAFVWSELSDKPFVPNIISFKK